MKSLGLIAVSALLFTSACDAPSSTGNNSSTQASSVPAPPKLTAEPIDSASLLAWIKAKDEFVPVDEYTKKFDDKPLIGHRFDLEIKAGGGALTTHYDADKEVLSVVVSTTMVVTSEGQEYLPIYHDDHYGDDYQAENAFGAKVSVTPENTTGYGVGGHIKSIGIFKRGKYSMLDSLARDISIKPDQARTLAEGLKLKVVGTMTKPTHNDESVIQCYDYDSKATVTAPFEHKSHECFASGHIEKITVSAANGDIVAAWN